MNFLNLNSLLKLACVALALASAAHAQTAKSRTDLYTELDTLFADTGEDPITPAQLRQALKNITASSYNGLTDGAGLSASTLNGYFADPSTNGSFSASAWRSDLGLVIGTNVQAYSANLSTYASITASANVQSLLGAADYAAIRALLDLEAGTDFLAKPTGTPDGTKYLRDDNTWQPITGGGDALVANPLTQFAGITTSNTEFNYVTGVTSAIQAQLNAKQAADADLTTYAGITPSANVQSVLSAADYAAIRTLLALVIGTNVQAYDADLSTYAGITPAANVQSLLGAADYAAMRTLLALVIGTNVQAYDADLDYLAGFTPTANVKSVLNAADYAAIRTLLSLVIGTNVQAYDADLSDLADGSLTGSAVAVASASAVGVVELATDGENAASVAVQGNDARINPTWGTLSGTSPALTFTAAQQHRTQTLTGNTTYTASGYAQGYELWIYLTGDSVLRTLAFPSWTWLEGAPAELAANKHMLIHLRCTSTTAASVFATYGVEL